MTGYHFNQHQCGSLSFLFSCSIVYAILRRKKFLDGDSQHDIEFIPFSNNQQQATLIVDCTHPTCKQLTHHLKADRQKALVDPRFRGDTSTESVLVALDKDQRDSLFFNQFRFVSSNHFDIDSFLSVWCILNRKLALSYKSLLYECSIIGDFRELQLENEIQDKALRILCWLNFEENQKFYRPFESKISAMDGEEDGVAKFSYFLPLLESALSNCNICCSGLSDYYRIISEYHLLDNTLQGHSRIFHDDIDLVLVTAPNPIHYYSLFSKSRNHDIVVAIYDDNRYEVELKYTTYVDLVSRSCYPRVEMQELANRLNTLESSGDFRHQWRANRVTDSGPLLRLEDDNSHLSKAERYGHPFQRRIYSSKISPEVFTDVVLSYFRFALGVQNNGAVAVERQRDWTWKAIHQFNSGIEWDNWSKSTDLIL